MKDWEVVAGVWNKKVLRDFKQGVYICFFLFFAIIASIIAGAAFPRMAPHIFMLLVVMVLAVFVFVSHREKTKKKRTEKKAFLESRKKMPYRPKPTVPSSHG